MASYNKIRRQENYAITNELIALLLEVGFSKAQIVGDIDIVVKGDMSNLQKLVNDNIIDWKEGCDFRATFLFKDQQINVKRGKR